MGNIIYQSLTFGGAGDGPVTGATRTNGESTCGYTFADYSAQADPSDFSGASDAQAIAWNRANAEGA